MVAPDRDWPPVPSVDAPVPNVARIYDYLLGGKDNFEADRAAAETLIRLIPDGVTACRENRQFVGRAVRYLVSQGIRQFIDIGPGLPTRDNVHEVALAAAPDARVVYADYDRVVVAHARALLAKPHPGVTAITGDLRCPSEILNDPELQALISLDQPFAVLATAVLHFIGDDEDPYAITCTLTDTMPPGSYLVISHITADDVTPDAGRKAQAVYEHATAQAHPRTRSDIMRFFDGLQLAAPGVVSVSAWRPQPLTAQSDGRTLMCAGVGRKPLTPKRRTRQQARAAVPSGCGHARPSIRSGVRSQFSCLMISSLLPDDLEASSADARPTEISFPFPVSVELACSSGFRRVFGGHGTYLPVRDRNRPLAGNDRSAVTP